MSRKIRNHNEWFQPVVRPKTCPTCGAKHQQVYAWGEYSRNNWNTVQKFCEHCWPRIKERLITHADPCGCRIVINARSGYSIPQWLSFDGNFGRVYPTEQS